MPVTRVKLNAMRDIASHGVLDRADPARQTIMADGANLVGLDD
jgi:hypothetical protein